ncbi:MAG: helix-turn-helix transcriptional regulator [Clostridia bacterium]|nr:helix-turn-helix transcriptional regulator [Clostridia bacterium]
MIRLKDLREDRDLSQKDVADILNISQTNYSKYELEKINIPIEYLRKLSLYFNTSIDYILGMTNEISPYPRLKNISSTDNCSK